MRKYRQVVEFANLICHFGDKVLLDYLDEIILPAFFTGTRVRTYGDSKYLLLDVELIRLKSAHDGKKNLAITGKFVLDTELRRDQILVNGALRSSSESIKSAPSSIFVLLLENHKLLYSKQVAGAPGLSAFRTTVEHLIRSSRLTYINGILKYNLEARSADAGVSLITRKSLMDAIPAPDVEVVPLSSVRNLERD